MTVPYPREFHYGDRGPDVEAVGRALAKWNKSLRTFVLRPKSVRRTWGKRKQGLLRQFKRTHKLPDNVKYGRATHEKLAPYFDAKAKKLLAEAKHPDSKIAAYNKLISVMKRMSLETPGYVFGGGHGTPLDIVRYSQGLDCSSSTSKALHDAGFYTHPYACVSGEFGNWGEPGKGKFFTVYYNPEHVWIRLHRGIYWRFDTSPHGSGGRGPRLRFTPRLTTSFRARHWPGM